MKTLLVFFLILTVGLPAADKQGKIPARIDAIAQMLSQAQRSRLLDLLNKGRDDTLRALPGVGKSRLAAIKNARPYNDITEITLVPGVGEGTFIDLVKHARAGFPKQTAKQP